MHHITDVISISCICVSAGPDSTTSMLVHIAIADYRGNEIIDCFVKPTMSITDYRTIEPTDISSAFALPFNVVQARVAHFIDDKVIVGHSLWKDLSVLGIPHPAVNTRDVALYQPFHDALSSECLVGLQTLIWKFMRRCCQQGMIHPLENARAALDLYRSEEIQWKSVIGKAQWPSVLPPSDFSRCFL
ncbi:hypothetical protein OF83DRAFT_1065920 [Amylostereum chailletii]|nr:hypothetical protein OF83DRAFT_1065920 [Amylostereum chailletii]